MRHEITTALEARASRRALGEPLPELMTAADLLPECLGIVSSNAMAKALYQMHSQGEVEREAIGNGKWAYRLATAPARQKKTRPAKLAKVRKPASDTPDSAAVAPAVPEAPASEEVSDIARAAKPSSWRLADHLDAVCRDLEHLVGDAVTHDVDRAELAAVIDLHLIAHRLQRRAAAAHTGVAQQ